MVTLPVAPRLPYVKTAIAAFDRQTHPNRELVIVVNGGDDEAREALLAYLGSLGRKDVRAVEVPGPAVPVGALRNVSFEEARGDVVCQWDDDDLYHPERVSRQLQAMTAADCEAAYLQEVMQYIPKAGALYWTNWAATEAKAHPGTLMARKDAGVRYDKQGRWAQLGEDLKVALDLEERGRVCRLAGQPHLFLYVNHGANSWDEAHLAMLTDRLAISKGLLSRREAQLREGLSAFQFGGPVQVCGANGPAFQIG
jgi:glycosyltransferase involved in cell wall biosynthesis